MKRLASVISIVLLAAGCAAHSQATAGASSWPPEETAFHSSRKDVARQILPSNVRLIVYDGDVARRTASGVVVASEGTTPKSSQSYILTNAHVLDTTGIAHPRFEVLVERRGKAVAHVAESVAQGSVPDLDLGLLCVRGIALPAAQLAQDQELEPGEDVMVVSAPFGKAISLSGGMVSQIEWDPQGQMMQVVKTDAAIGYGASGGGIYSVASGKLLAVVEGYRTAKIGFAIADQPYSFDVPMPGETFAAPTAKIRAFLRTNGFGRFVETTQTAQAAVR